MNLSYGGHEDVVALNNINVDIPKNRITTIIGPSGSGKTTLLKSLNRLHEIKDNIQVKGEIYIGRENILASNQPVWELRRKVGLISQKPYPLPASIYENIAYGPRIHGRRSKKELDKIVRECLQKVWLWSEIKNRLDSPAADLSVGQLQRLSIARSLSVEPEVLLCDEVTSALDPISSEKVENLLLSLKKDYTIVMVTHVLRQARRMADYVVFLYLGKVVEMGYAEQFFENPTHKKTKEYIKGTVAGI